MTLVTTYQNNNVMKHDTYYRATPSITFSQQEDYV